MKKWLWIIAIVAVVLYLRSKPAAAASRIPSRSAPGVIGAGAGGTPDAQGPDPAAAISQLVPNYGHPNNPNDPNNLFFY